MKVTRNIDLHMLALAVDELGKVKAQMSKLAEREQELKQLFIDSGVVELNGNNYRVTVSHTLRVSLDTSAARDFLSPVEVLQCSRETVTTTVRCTARIVKGC